MDDSPELAARMARFVERGCQGIEGIQIQQLSDDHLATEVEVLLERQKMLRDHPRSRQGVGDAALDRADILVIDFDLAGLFGTEALMTGELLARLARSFALCGPIVSVNRFGERTFKLTLRDTEMSWADLNVSHSDLRDSGLWTGNWGEFRPWSWPVLLDFPEDFSKRVAFCKEKFDQKIGRALGIPRSVSMVFPDELLVNYPDLLETSFSRLARTYLLPPKDMGLPKRFAARVVASEIGRWLDKVVLPGQNVLIDAPHLGQLFPSLVKYDGGGRNVLNRLAELKRDASLPLDASSIGEVEFDPEFWLSRRAWWTDLLLENQAIEEVQKPWKRKGIKVVFAEDTSRFEQPSDCTEFRAEGLFLTRWVRKPDPSIPYEPATRLAA